ncbi:MAG: DUF4129 domain-containing protein [Acidilobaceae archaeon]
MRKLIIIIIITIAFLAQVVLASEEGLIATKLHTLGFPQKINYLEALLYYLNDILQNQGKGWSEEDLKRLLELVHENCSSVECLAEDPKARIALEELLAQYNLSYSHLSEASIEDLINSIENKEWAEILKEINFEGVLDILKLKNLLEQARQSFYEDKLKITDYQLVLEVLKRYAENAGYSSLLNEISSEQAKTLVQMAKELLYNSLTATENWSLVDTSEKPLGLPSPQLPQAGISFDMLTQLPSLGVIAPLLFASALLVFSYPLLKVLLSGVTTLETQRIERSWKSIASKQGGVMGLYWKAVDFVEKRTNRIMEDSMTHREFLLITEKDLREKAQAFRDLTLDYELSRYGGLSNEDLVRDAEEKYRRLTSSS